MNASNDRVECPTVQRLVADLSNGRSRASIVLISWNLDREPAAFDKGPPFVFGAVSTNPRRRLSVQ